MYIADCAAAITSGSEALCSLTLFALETTEATEGDEPSTDYRSSPPTPGCVDVCGAPNPPYGPFAASEPSGEPLAPTAPCVPDLSDCCGTITEDGGAATCEVVVAMEAA
jgi:hypothetical protein